MGLGMKKYSKIVCGKTRSGKPIYEHPISDPCPDLHEAHRDFDPQEPFDAFTVFTFLEDRSGLRLGLDNRWVEHYAGQATVQKEVLERLGKLEEVREEAGVVTIFDLRHYARKLVHLAYRGD